VTLYSVYEPPGEAQDLEDRADSLVFVKEGFSWPALLVPGFWLFYRCMWLELVLFLGLFLVLGWAFGPSDAGQTIFGWLSLALVVLFAFEANDLRRAALERRGYKQMGTAIGAGRDDAERVRRTDLVRGPACERHERRRAGDRARLAEGAR